MGTIDITSDPAPLEAEIKALETKIDGLTAAGGTLPTPTPLPASSQTFVVKDSSGAVLFQTAGSGGSNPKIDFQADGNLVVYAPVKESLRQRRRK